MSSLYFCRLMHHRLEPEYRFRHSLCIFLIDLDETRFDSWLLGLNRAALFSFRDEDHFRFTDQAGLTTRQKVDRFLGERPERVELLTNLRVAGYTFNPVSFYFCHFNDGRTEVLVEVNNTYGEQKPFLVRAGQPLTHTKDFYVSPFIRHDRSFRFKISKPSGRLAVEISAVTAEGRLILKGVLCGRRREISSWSVLGAFLRYPFYTLRIIALIHWHAFRLYLKGVPHFAKAESARN